MNSTNPAVQYATPLAVNDPNECYFYHQMEITGVGLVKGDWDLRDCINPYLGNYDFKGKRVLDVGAASGFLTFSMEKLGADVVSFDMASGSQWDVVPQREFRIDPETYMAKWVEGNRRLKNGYWFTHARLGSRRRLTTATSTIFQRRLECLMWRFSG